jgi:hypothetical protein
MAVDWENVASSAVNAMKGVFKNKWGEVAALAAFHGLC